MALQFGSADEVDDEVEAAPEVPLTLAQRMQADINARKTRRKVLTHPSAAAWRAEYRLPLDRRELIPLEKASEQAVKRGDPLTYHAAVLATYCTRLWFMGELVEGSDGAPLTFRDRELRELIGLPAKTTASETVAAVYAADGVVESLWWRLLDEAGFATQSEVEVDDEDPTSAG